NSSRRRTGPRAGSGLPVHVLPWRNTKRGHPHPTGGPFVKSCSRWASEAPRIGDDVLLVNRRGYELETVPPHDVLDIIRIGPEGVEDVVRAGSHIGVITEEAAAELIAGINGMRAEAVRDVRRDVPNEVIKSGVMDVWAEISAVDSALGWRRTRKTCLPRRNVVPTISTEVNVTICRRRCSRKHVLDRTCWRRRVKHRAIAAVSCLTAVRVRVRRRLSDRIPIGSLVAAREDRLRIGPRSAAIR